jgi:hypothetical protein
MKNIFTLVLCISCILLFVEANQAMSYELDKKKHDYGIIPEGSNGICFFTLTNTGSYPIQILKANTTCGCDVIRCDASPIAPGASSEIRYSYDHDHLGTINKSPVIVIGSDLGEKDTVVLSVCGYIYDRLLGIPKDIDKLYRPCPCSGYKSREKPKPLTTLPFVALLTKATGPFLKTPNTVQTPLSDCVAIDRTNTSQLDSVFIDQTIYTQLDSISKGVTNNFQMDSTEIAGSNRSGEQQAAALNMVWEMAVFPNPLQSTANIRWNNDMENGILILYNMQGQVIREERNIRGRSVEWNDLDLSSGTYILTLYQNQQAFGTLRCIVH